MKRTYLFTTVKWLVVLFLIMFLGFQTYRSLYSSYSTESAIYYEDYDGIPITGLVIRDENIITVDSAGVMSYTVPRAVGWPRTVWWPASTPARRPPSRRPGRMSWTPKSPF